MDPNPRVLREPNVRRFSRPRVLWWDLGNHMRVPSSAPDIELEIIRGPLLPRGALDRVDLMVAEAHDLRRQEVRRSLISALKANLRPPIVLLTAADPDNMRFLCHLSVDDLAWSFERQEEALSRGLRLVRGTERKRVAEHLLRSCSDRPTVEPVVKRLFLDPKPPFQVQQLARSCLVSRRTLERRWKGAWPRGAELPLKALVDWALGGGSSC